MIPSPKRPRAVVRQATNATHESEPGIAQLTAGIAHDTNNLLTAIVGSLDLARTGSEREKDRALSSAIVGLQSVSETIGELLTFSRIGQPTVKPKNLASVVRRWVDMAIAGHDQGPEIRLKLPKTNCPCLIDESQISRVIINVLKNAVHASDKQGSIDISLSVVESSNNMNSTNDGHFRLSFVDTGVGISPDHLAFVFKPFFTTRKDGHGLGLATSHFIVTNHQGTMTLDSTPGHGTTVNIFLPIAAIS